MKTKDIEEGATYVVRLTEEQATVYRGCEVRAKVIRAGFHYDVDYTSGSMIRGAPNTWTQRSEHPNGVEVEWERQEVPSNLRKWRFPETVHPGRAIVNARAVKYKIEEE